MYKYRHISWLKKKKRNSFSISRILDITVLYHQFHLFLFLTFIFIQFYIIFYEPFCSCVCFLFILHFILILFNTTVHTTTTTTYYFGTKYKNSTHKRTRWSQSIHIPFTTRIYRHRFGINISTIRQCHLSQSVYRQTNKSIQMFWLCIVR